MTEEWFDPKVVARARQLCKAECPTLMCNTEGHCYALWPSLDVKGFPYYLEQASDEIYVERLNSLFT